MAQDEFDPIAYIEKAFVENPNKIPAVPESDEEMDLPSIQEFLSNAETEPKPRKPRKPRTATTPSPKLSAPRPRRRAKKAEPKIDGAIESTWSALPKNIAFLSSFFDDTVTANYYRGEFKESREELIQRILDPELSLEEVSRLLGVCPATVRRYTNRGWLEHHRTQGGQRRFRLSGLVKFVDEHGRHA